MGSSKFDNTEMDEEILNMVKNIFNIERMKICMSEHSLDLDKLPIGLLTIDKIKQCHLILCEIQRILVTTQANTKQSLIISLTNDFYVTIPHNFGMKKPPILDHLMRVKEKTRMLEQLQDIYTMQQIFLQSMKFDLKQRDPYEALHNELCVQLTRLPRDNDYFQTINQAIYNTQAATHRSQIDIAVKDIYEIRKPSEKLRFFPFEKKIHNKFLLWHGFRTQCVASILRNGIRLPHADSA